MKNFLLTIALILAASTPRASGQDAADTSSGAAADTAKRTVAADTSKRAPADAPVADTAGGASVNTAVNTPADTPVTASVNTPVNTPVDTPVNTLINTPVDTPVDTPANVSINAPIDAPPADNTPVNAPVNADAPKKIFILPAYTFHIAFLAASIALIAATLYFFLTRRDDSRRFLTTTRLSVLDKLVQRGCRHIESNYPDPALTPETVCNSLVTGKAYLDALFMNELGINVQDFIVQVRVNAIKNRLSAAVQAQQPPDIDEICAECGFADKAEAERCFSGVCGGMGIAEFTRFSKMQNQKR